MEGILHAPAVIEDQIEKKNEIAEVNYGRPHVQTKKDF